MTAIRTTIRPRTRSAETLSRSEQPAARVPEAPQQPPEQDIPLPVLARLPDVSLAEDKGKLAIRLDWLTQLDWKAMRRLKLDPNWVAGGVLSLVLLLLVVITLNRGSKPADSLPGEIEAPSFQGTAAHGHESQNVSVGQSAPAKQPGKSTTELISQSSLPSGARLSDGLAPGIAPSQTVADVNRLSLEGIYYPRTPHGADSSNVVQATTQPTVFPPAPSGYDNGIRTAQRDPLVSRGPQPTSIPPGHVQPAHAQLDGFITQPQGIRNP